MSSRHDPHGALLTPRQQIAIQLLHEGLSYAEIADRLGVQRYHVFQTARKARQRFLDCGLEPPPKIAVWPVLTLRELEVVQGIWEGLTCDEIARRLNSSPKTVKNHASHAAKRLGIRKHYFAVPLALWYERNEAHRINRRARRRKAKVLLSLHELDIARRLHAGHSISTIAHDLGIGRRAVGSQVTDAAQRIGWPGYRGKWRLMLALYYERHHHKPES